MNLELLATILAALLLRDILKPLLKIALSSLYNFNVKHDLRNLGLKPTDPKFIKDERNRARWDI